MAVNLDSMVPPGKAISVPLASLENLAVTKQAREVRGTGWAIFNHCAPKAIQSRILACSSALSGGASCGSRTGVSCCYEPRTNIAWTT